MIKRCLQVLCIVMGLFLVSCDKNEDNANTGTPVTEFKFYSLDADSVSMKVNGSVGITANAQGDGLEYIWDYSGGSLLGAGKHVQFTVCHAGKFTVSCQVKDSYNHSDTKNVTLHVHE